jgi:hypothetical protein
MKLAGILLAAALVCAAQIGTPAAAPPIQPLPTVPPFDRVAIGTLETQFESRIDKLDLNDPVQKMGACSGVYVPGYGMVFTLPVVLATTPAISPFHMKITPQEVASVHKRKLAHVPALKTALTEMLINAYKAMPNLPASDKVAVGVRVFYLDWEDKSGLPSLIVVSADRASALAGNIQVDER